jgi:hypothetical protein
MGKNFQGKESENGRLNADVAAAGFYGLTPQSF